jgi:class 3 adenylate cyclase/CheY-like chemotaxis protein
MDGAAGTPGGTVSLLFTDIEGSTALVQALGNRYPAVLAQHRRLIRAAVAEAGGHEVDCRGDEFFVVFATPDAAVEAALAAQEALDAHDWPDGRPVRVRMGIHAGCPVREGDGYFGVDVHRAARICQAGHGGQVLVSEAVIDAVPGLAADDLGVFALKGLPTPERLFELRREGRPEVPPPRAEQALPNTVPTRVVLADDSVLLREGIARLLEDAGCEIVGQAGDAEDLLRDVAAHRPDVAIVDLRMPPTHTDEGLRAARRIRDEFPGTGVLVLSQHVEPAYAAELIGDDAAGTGYLLKDRVADIDEFADAVKRIAAGGSALDPTLSPG